MLNSHWFKAGYARVLSWVRASFSRIKFFITGNNADEAQKIDSGLKKTLTDASWFDKFSSWWFMLRFWYKAAVTVLVVGSMGLIGLAFQAPMLMVGVGISLLFLISTFSINVSFR